MFEGRGIAFGGLWASDGNGKLERIKGGKTRGCEPEVGDAGEQYWAQQWEQTCSMQRLHSCSPSRENSALAEAHRDQAVGRGLP